MDGWFRRRAIDRVATAAGDRSIDEIATFRRFPLVAYLSRIVLVVAGITGLATDQLWARVTVLACIVGFLFVPDRTVTVAVGSGSAFIGESTAWRRDRREGFARLDPSEIERIDGFRWAVDGRRLWAWTDGRRLLEQIAARQD